MYKNAKWKIKFFNIIENNWRVIFFKKDTWFKKKKKKNALYSIHHHENFKLQPKWKSFKTKVHSFAKTQNEANKHQKKKKILYYHSNITNIQSSLASKSVKKRLSHSTFLLGLLRLPKSSISDFVQNELIIIYL